MIYEINYSVFKYVIETEYHINFLYDIIVHIIYFNKSNFSTSDFEKRDTISILTKVYEINDVTDKYKNTTLFPNNCIKKDELKITQLEIKGGY